MPESNGTPKLRATVYDHIGDSIVCRAEGGIASIHCMACCRSTIVVGTGPAAEEQARRGP